MSFVEDLTRSQPQSSVLSDAQGFKIFREDADHAGTTSSGYRPPRKQKAYALHWLTMLQKGSFLGVTDERDRIFGSLGMLQSAATRSYVSKPRSTRHLDLFPVDYQWTLSKTYQYCVKHLINADRDLRALIVFEDRRKRSSDLPSWTVDWRQCQPRFFGFDSPDSLRNEFHKLQTSFESSKAAYQDFGCSGELVLRGSVIEMSLQPAQKHSGDDWNGKIYGVAKINPSTSMEPHLSIGQVLTLLLVSGAYVSRRIAFGGSRYYWNEALVPSTAEPGDIFVWFEGTNCINLLRPCDAEGSGRSYVFVGPIALIRATGIGTTVSIRFSLDLVKAKEELGLLSKLEGPMQWFTLQ